MSWKITVSHIDEKTGEYIANEATVTDESVKSSNFDALDRAFEEITNELERAVKENT